MSFFSSPAAVQKRSRDDEAEECSPGKRTKVRPLSLVCCRLAALVPAGITCPKGTPALGASPARQAARAGAPALTRSLHPQTFALAEAQRERPSDLPPPPPTPNFTTALAQQQQRELEQMMSGAMYREDIDMDMDGGEMLPSNPSHPWNAAMAPRMVHQRASRSSVLSISYGRVLVYRVPTLCLPGARLADLAVLLTWPFTFSVEPFALDRIVDGFVHADDTHGPPV